MTTLSSRGNLAGFLMTGFAIFAGLSPLSAQTWLGGTDNPTDDWHINSNWNTNTPPAAGGTALFKTSANTSIAIGSAATAGTLRFNNVAPAYTFNLNTGASTLTLDTDGITNNSSFNPTFNIDAGTVRFTNSASASNAALNTFNSANLPTTVGTVTFSDSSTAGQATITNANGAVNFENSSTAGHATINNTITAFLRITAFKDSSSAGQATITNTGTGGGVAATSFQDNSTAKNANITNNTGGFTAFAGTATADNATVTNEGGSINFQVNSTAKNAILNNNSGILDFSGDSSAGQAVITNKDQLRFWDNATAKASTIGNNAGATTVFNDSAKAGTAAITNSDATVTFNNSSSADHATLTNTSTVGDHGITFNNSSTAAQANITNGGGGLTSIGFTRFNDTSTAKNAVFTNNAFGYLGFTGTSTAGQANITNYTNGYTEFNNDASADHADITSDGGRVSFFLTSTADEATILNKNGGTLYFTNTSTAANAEITNNKDSFTMFQQSSSAGKANITNNKGNTYFVGDSTANKAVIVNKNKGTTIFSDSAKAGTADITNKEKSGTEFRNDTSAQQATITNDDGKTIFFDQATAKQATIVNKNGGSTEFYDASKAGSATITNKASSSTEFSDFSSAQQADITNDDGRTVFASNATARQATLMNKNNGKTVFTDASTADDAIITNQSTGKTVFKDNASGGKARINNKAGGLLDISDLTNGGMTIGTVSGAGDIKLGQNNLTFLGRNDEDHPVISGVISGGANGSITLNSPDALNLSNANTYKGGTFLQNGTLVAGDANALGKGNVNVTGGVLKMNNNTDVIKVGGNYTQTGGALNLKMLGSSNNDNQLIRVQGNVTLGSGSSLKIIGGDTVTYADGLSYDLIRSVNGTVSGHFGTVSGLDSFVTPADRFAAIGYTQKTVYLSFFQYLANLGGLTPNQRSVATYVDTYAASGLSGNFGQLVTNLYPLANDPTALGAALDQISPQSLQVFGHIAFDNATFASQQLNTHLANRRDGQSGFDGSQMTYQDASLSAPLAQIKGRLLAYSPAPGAISDIPSDLVLSNLGMSNALITSMPTDPWSTFIAGNVILADVKDSGLSDQNYTTGSVTMGADYKLNKNFTVGALFAYAHTDADLDNLGSKATVDSYSPGIYAAYSNAGWYGNALFAYNYNSYTSDRNVLIGGLTGTNSGAPQGNQFTGNLTGGYEFEKGNWKFGPVGSIQYSNLSINSFDEAGPTALNVQEQNDDSLRTQLGIEARYSVKSQTCYGPMVFTPHVGASWQHEFLNDSRGITSQFNQIGGGSFAVQTSDPERDSAFITVGLNVDFARNVTGFFDYATQVGQDNYFGQSFQGGVKIGF